MTKLGQAFRNMLRAARRDPGWALKAILLSPLWAPLYLLKTLLLMILALSLVGLAAAGLLIALHLDHSKIANIVLSVVILVTLLVTTLWALTHPLLKHFADRESGTHGTARFATEKETARLAQHKADLLLGRDINTGKLLRYAGAAHLLTMAPTRTGAGQRPHIIKKSGSSTKYWSFAKLKTFLMSLMLFVRAAFL